MHTFGPEGGNGVGVLVGAEALDEVLEKLVIDEAVELAVAIQLQALLTRLATFPVQP